MSINSWCSIKKTRHSHLFFKRLPCTDHPQINTVFQQHQPKQIERNSNLALRCKQNCGSFSKLIFNRPKFFWWVQVGYAGPRRSSVPPNPRFVCRWRPHLQAKREFSTIKACWRCQRATKLTFTANHLFLDFGSSCNFFGADVVFNRFKLCSFALRCSHLQWKRQFHVIGIV